MSLPCGEMEKRQQRRERSHSLPLSLFLSLPCFLYSAMFARDISMLDLRPKFAYSLPPLSVCNCEPTIPLLYLWISYLASLSGLEANGTLIVDTETRTTVFQPYRPDSTECRGGYKRPRRREQSWRVARLFSPFFCWQFSQQNDSLTAMETRQYCTAEHVRPLAAVGQGTLQPQRPPPMVVCRESGAPSAEAAAADSSTLPRRKRGRPLAFFAAESPRPRRKIHPNSGTCFHLRAKI